MSNHRYSKFWWQDWQRDGALRMCSMAARGLWMELLCLAHDGSPVGHVTVNGKAPTPRQIAAISGCSERDVTKLLRELEESGVFSRTDNGVIFSRRMVRDADKSEEGRQHVSKRWSSGSGYTPPDKHPNRSTHRGATTQYSEAESESLKRSNLNEAGGGQQPASRASDGPLVGPEATEAVVVSMEKALHIRAYPPGKMPQRTADQQRDAVTPTRPKAMHLTREQINASLRRKA